MTPESWLLLAAVAFLLGYLVGHRHGRIEGFRDGAAFAPIEMRREALERGRCIICGTAARRRPEPVAGQTTETVGAGRRSATEGE